MTEITTNPWEFETDEQALLELGGNVSSETYRQDRLQRANDVQRVCAIHLDHQGFEIGSGDGTVAQLLAAHCAFIDCTDISVSFLAKARQNCRSVPNLAFHQISGWSLAPLESGRYDFGYSLNVFIHLNPYDIHLYLQEVRRLLKPGGSFYFDACTIGAQTRDIFHEHAKLFQQAPQNLRGLLSFNHPDLIRTVVADVGLEVDEARSRTKEQDGWLGFLVRAPRAQPAGTRSGRKR